MNQAEAQYYDPGALLAAKRDAELTWRRLGEMVQRDPDTLKKVFAAADGKISSLFTTAAALGCEVEITVRRRQVKPAES